MSQNPIVIENGKTDLFEEKIYYYEDCKVTVDFKNGEMYRAAVKQGEWIETPDKPLFKEKQGEHTSFALHLDSVEGRALIKTILLINQNK